MKKMNKKSMIFLVVALILIVTGIVLVLTGNNKSLSNKNEEGSENYDDPTKPMEKVFNKADVMSLIYQFKSIEESSGDWYVGDTALLAHNADNTKYLARYKRVLNNGSTEEYETIVTYDENGYSIDLPGWEVDSKNLDEFSFIYYKEGEEGYDPVNQQYNQVDVGWTEDQNKPWENYEQQENTWENYQYVPDNSWQNQTW